MPSPAYVDTFSRARHGINSRPRAATDLEVEALDWAADPVSRRRLVRCEAARSWSGRPLEVPHIRCAPLPTKPGLARVSRMSAQVGQARLAVGRGWGWG